MTADKKSAQTANWLETLLPIVTEAFTPSPDDPLGMIAWIRLSISTSRKLSIDSDHGEMLDHALAMLASAEHALRRGQREGLADALRYVWHAGNACAAAAYEDELQKAIRSWLASRLVSPKAERVRYRGMFQTLRVASCYNERKLTVAWSYKPH